MCNFAIASPFCQPPLTLMNDLKNSYVPMFQKGNFIPARIIL